VLLQYQLRGDYLQKIKDKIVEDETFRECDVEADTAKHAPVNSGGLFPSSKDSWKHFKLNANGIFSSIWMIITYLVTNLSTSCHGLFQQILLQRKKEAVSLTGTSLTVTKRRHWHRDYSYSSRSSTRCTKCVINISFLSLTLSTGMKIWEKQTVLKIRNKIPLHSTIMIALLKAWTPKKNELRWKPEHTHRNKKAPRLWCFPAIHHSLTT